MTIPASAQIPALLASNRSVQFVDSNGILTSNGKAVLDSIYNFINGCSRVIPCTASTSSNVITLTMLSTSPLYKGYADYDKFQFFADATSTGTVTAKVVTSEGTLATLNVYKNNGAAQAGAGDISTGLQYEFTYIDAFNSGAGGLVLR